MSLESRPEQPRQELPEPLVHRMVRAIAIVRGIEPRPIEEVTMCQFTLDILREIPQTRERLAILNSVPEEKFAHMYKVMMSKENPSK